MDPTTIINVVKEGMEIVQPVFEPGVQTVVSTLIATIFLKKNTDIEAIEKLKANKFEEVITDLINQGKMTYLELYRCKNFLQIARLADKMYGKNFNERKEKTEFDFDWFMRFFDAAGNISNEELQKLWAQILNNEIQHPNNCSLRTLEILRNMSASEAKMFQKLCQFVVQSGNMYFILPHGFLNNEEDMRDCQNYIKSQGMNYVDAILPMFEANILTADHDLITYMNEGNQIAIHNQKIWGSIMCLEGVDILLQQEAYCLTASGIQLYKIIADDPEFEVDTDYLLRCLKQMKTQMTNFEFHAYLIYKYSEEGAEIVGNDLLL